MCTVDDWEKLLFDGLVFGRTYLIPVEKRKRFQEKCWKAIAAVKERQQMQVNKGNTASGWMRCYKINNSVEPLFWFFWCRVLVPKLLFWPCLVSRALVERWMEQDFWKNIVAPLAAFPLSSVNFFRCACALVNIIFSACINWFYKEKLPLPVHDLIIFILAKYMLLAHS